MFFIVTAFPFPAYHRVLLQ